MKKFNFAGEFRKNWKEHFCNPIILHGILQEIGYEDYGGFGALEISHLRVIDEKRVVIIAQKDTADGQSVKIVFDIKTGKPSWNQVIEMNFGVGADADLKLVICDLSDSQEEKDDPTIDLGLVCNLCHIISYYNKNSHLVIAKQRLLGSVKNGVEYELAYDGNYLYTHTDGAEFKGVGFPTLPPREMFDSAEFWVAYFDGTLYSKDCELAAWAFPCGWFDYEQWRESTIKFGPIWSEDGLFVKIYGESDPWKLQWLWKNRCPQLEKYNDGAEVTLNKRDDIPFEILVQIDPTPFSVVTKSSNENKK